MSNRLKDLRIENKISGIALAKKLGISPQYYYGVEKGERRLTSDIAVKAAAVLNTTVDYLLGATDERPEERKKSPDPHEESELSEIPIERLNQFKLSYKGHSLSKDEADDIIELLEAALKRWKK